MSALNVGLLVSTKQQNSLLYWSRSPVAKQQVGNDAIKPDEQRGQMAYFSIDDFNESSSKMALVATGFDLFDGVVNSDSSSPGEDIDDTSLSAVQSIVDRRFRGFGLRESRFSFLPLVLVDNTAVLPPDRCQPPLEASLLFSDLVVGCHTRH